VALEDAKLLLSDYRGSVALRENAEGVLVNGSPSGVDIIGKLSPAAKADGIYSTFDKGYYSAFFSFDSSCVLDELPIHFPPSDVAPAAAAAASYLLGPEVTEPPGVGDEEI